MHRNNKHQIVSANYKNGNNNSNALLTKEMSNFEVKTVIFVSFSQLLFDVF